jgi:hypothetical protein
MRDCKAVDKYSESTPLGADLPREGIGPFVRTTGIVRLAVIENL